MKEFIIGVVLLISLTPAYSQFTVSGTVKDESGNTLIGANVVLRGTYFGTSTDFDGKFEFQNVKKGNYSLDLSYIGFGSKEVSVEVKQNLELEIELERTTTISDEVIVKATRIDNHSPGTFSNVSKEDISRTNLGADIPMLLELTPSIVSSSDAGNGIGYTNMRIRGTDMSRINFTVNGIPLNDAESHTVFWVNMPDFATSVDNIQIQRGVGTSTNGAAAFGATVDMKTNSWNPKPYAEISSSYGSFNTLKNTVSVGSGKVSEKFSFDARLSGISSDGYIDRASSDLKSFYLSGAYRGEKDFLRLLVFSGKERTYQSWNGVPKVRLENDLEGMQRYEDHWLYSAEETENMINSDSRTYNIYTYENQVDDYQQDHYQLHYSYNILRNLYLNTALHYTYGQGFYEQYKEGEDFSDYNLDNIIIGDEVITSTDLIRRKWLDNDFYGITWSAVYDNKNRLNATFGGSWNKYDGDHFGEIIWAEFAGNSLKGYEWYNNTGIKTDFNVFTKVNYQVFENLYVFADLQLRNINYKINGIHDDLRDISQKHDFSFFNPKGGILYNLNSNSKLYVNIAQSHREPARTSYRDVDSSYTPKAEELLNTELGYSLWGQNYHFSVNIYNMSYTDQLVLSGEINSVGSAIMVNVPESYRRGIEFIAAWKPGDKMFWQLNASFSENKIKSFTSYVDDWDSWGQIAEDIGETNLSFSPSVVLGNMLEFDLNKGFRIALQTKYVGKQYIDNTSSESRMLDAYTVSNLLLNYRIPVKKFGVEVKFSVNNLLDEEYESNAWVYRYYLGGEFYEMDGYFPQAGRNFMAGLVVRF